MDREVIRFSNEIDWVHAIVAKVETLAANAAEQGKSSFHMSLAGGSTPEPVYRALAISAVLSSFSSLNLHIWVGDERDVAPDSPQRNGFLILKTFNDEATGAWNNPPCIHPWPAGNRRISATLYEDMIRKELGSNPVFDLFVLGLGTDGHTAGLFSVSDARSEGFPCTVVTTAPQEPTDRMSMTGNLIRSAESILILARGEGKGHVLYSFLEGYPIPLNIATGFRGLAYYLES
jgi:6-phosphogluconolactonase